MTETEKERQGGAENAENPSAQNGSPDIIADEDISEEELHSPEVELQGARGELEALEDRYLRVRAEFENYRRRTTQDLTSAWNRAQADFVSSLLEALDDLQRVGAWEVGSTTVEALIEGVDLVERKFAQALQSAGVAMVQPEQHAKFDPNTMEAMLRVDTDDEEQDDSVAEVFARGYQLGETLIRPARVSVYKTN